MRGDLDLALEHAHERPGTVHRCRFSVGGVSVQLLAARNTDVALGPLEPFRVEQAASDVEIRIEWASSLRLPEGSQVFDSGSVWRLYDDGPGFQFDFSTPQLGERPYKRLFVDRQFRDAELQLNREYFTDSDDAVACLEYPLDELLIMHRLTQERAIELHGVGIVGPDGASNLFVGHSGAGKSTTARLWTTLHKVEILSDDRIIVREHSVREHPRHQSNLSAAATQIYMYGTPWHGEAHFALPQRAPLQRIFVLEHGHGNVLTRLTRSQMVAELFARAFVPFHRHQYVDSALSFLERVADSVPCYHYSFEPDERAVETVLHFQD
jgi:energy-coupling factor transporter ATP-binding protein EcfA2